MKSIIIKSALGILTLLFLLSFSGNMILIENSESYWPLNIKEKKIRWYNTEYIETQKGMKKLQGKEYHVYEQKWKDGQKDLLYLREENGIIYQYEKNEINHETIRYNHAFKKKDSWGVSFNSKLYKVLTYSGTLVTPHGKFTDLLVIQAKFDNGSFKFYYQKGKGYIGSTTKKDGLISYLREL